MAGQTSCSQCNDANSVLACLNSFAPRRNLAWREPLAVSSSRRCDGLIFAQKVTGWTTHTRDCLPFAWSPDFREPWIKGWLGLSFLFLRNRTSRPSVSLEFCMKRWTCVSVFCLKRLTFTIKRSFPLVLALSWHTPSMEIVHDCLYTSG